MPSIKTDQLETQLRSKKIGSLYLFDGPEDWLKDRFVTRLIEALIPKEARDFNLDRYNGQTHSASDIVNSIESLPWMNDRRLVIVQSADEFSAADGKIIAQSLQALPETTCCVFLYEGKANLREEIPAAVGSHGNIVTFWTPFPNQIPAWVTQEAKRFEKGITYEAAAELADSCGDLQVISNELEKLSLFIGEKKTIELKDIRLHGLPDQEGDYDQFEEALWNRNFPETLRQANLMTEMGTRAESLFPVVERVFRTLTLAHFHHKLKRAGAEEIFQTLGIRGKTQQGNILAGLKAYKPLEAQRAIEATAQADYELKTGMLSSSYLVSLLLVRVCGGRG